ncbi:MAG TPA: S8 family serine peptidase [Candidatus Binatia bacterium]|nr:S8 family serine peptidase [Candidatus Binatia bacterium]
MATRKSRKVKPPKLGKQGFTIEPFETPDTPDYVVAELRYESPVAYTRSHFAAPAAGANQASRLNDVLEKFDIASVRSQFGFTATEVRSRIELAAALPKEPSANVLKAKGADAEFRQSGFVQIVPKRDQDCKRLATALSKSEAVWDAYVAPRPVPAGLSGSTAGTRLFEPAQGYLYSAPVGIGATDVWGLAGAKGNGVTICDIEGAWNTKHEDLPAGISLIGGTMIADIAWRNHGTAVLGEMISVPNSKGCVGISHAAKAVVHSTVINGVFNTAQALTNATAHLKKGDVILIELQGTGPNNKYVAMQYWSDVFSAIVAATAKGITVVEAAGNGNENFNLPIFNNTGLQKDSGAIVVGAGIPPSNAFDFDGSGGFGASYQNIGVPRSRIWFSNYGKIVNVQGWGFHVATLAYGDMQGDPSENKWYTLRFSGTSSASPIVTGAVACIQGRAKAKNGSPLTPAKVRSILMASGSPQQAGPGVPLSQRIGPLPNLLRAMALV